MKGVDAEEAARYRDQLRAGRRRRAAGESLAAIVSPTGGTRRAEARDIAEGLIAPLGFRLWPNADGTIWSDRPAEIGEHIQGYEREVWEYLVAKDQQAKGARNGPLKATG